MFIKLDIYKLDVFIKLDVYKIRCVYYKKIWIFKEEFTNEIWFKKSIQHITFIDRHNIFLYINIDMFLIDFNEIFF